MANAICEKSKKPIVGIRPGEKIHEEMITPSDSFNTFDIGKYYVILPNNKKIQDNFINAFKKAKKVKPGFSYNSRDNDSWETVSSLKQKIKFKIKLMSVIPYGKQFIDKEDIDAVVKVLKSDF